MSVHFKRIEGHDALTGAMAFALSELDRKFFPTPWSTEAWASLFEGHDRSLSVVEMNHEIVGFSLFDLSRADSFAHLLKILVHPDFRGQHFGKKLLAFDLGQLHQQGIKHFFLEVEEDNYAAQKLYLHSGFKMIHKKKDFYGNGRSALIMTADLQ